MLSRLALYVARTNWRAALRSEIGEQVRLRCQAEYELRSAESEIVRLKLALATRDRESHMMHGALRVILSARHRFSPLETLGFLAELPLLPDGSLDEAQLAERVFDAVAGLDPTQSQKATEETP